MGSPTVEQLIRRLIQTVKKPNVTEAARIDELACIRLLWSIYNHNLTQSSWNRIWADVMQATGCDTWDKMVHRVGNYEGEVITKH